MGAYTPNAQVWYPDTSDTAELNVLLSTLASSIEVGIGERLAAQEELISAVLTVNTSGTINLPANTEVTIPFIVDTFGYNTGDMTLSSGVITINTPGVYFVSSTMTFNDQANYFVHSVKISGVEKVRGFSFFPKASFFQYSAQTAVVKLNAGDTIATVVNSTGAASTVRNVSIAGNVMTVTLLKPL